MDEVAFLMNSEIEVQRKLVLDVYFEIWPSEGVAAKLP